MEKVKILNFVEDKNVTINKNWYLHATKNDIEIIKKILEEGIKSAYLRNQKGNGFNGQYYISLYKNTNEPYGLNAYLCNNPKFIIDDISPFYANKKKYNFRHIFKNTRVPLRTSHWNGEFQQYLKIEPNKIVALEYSLSHILSNLDSSNIKEKLLFLKNMVLCMEQVNRNLPIYDLSSNREINKEKILTLSL